MTALKAWLKDRNGSTAAEFALVLIPAVLLIFGLIHFGLLMYSSNRLKYAVEATARCRALSENAVVANPGYLAPCRDTATAQQYFTDHYKGAATVAAPTIQKDISTPSCGWQVSATGAYTISAVFTRTVTLRATSCFPA